MSASLMERISSLKETWWIKGLFISTTSFFNAILLVFVIYFWTMNRQTHLKKTKGSNVPFKQRIDSDHTLILEEEEEEDVFPELDLATSTPSTETPRK
jgi:hypothetical protein